MNDVAVLGGEGTKDFRDVIYGRPHIFVSLIIKIEE